MKLLRPVAALCLGMTLFVSFAHAEASPTPLRLIPEGADLLIEVAAPRRVVEAVVGLDLLKQLQAFSLAREYLDSTNAKRFYQFLAYYEKELGAPWPELLDKLAGGGMAAGFTFAADPIPAILVIQGRDRKMVEKFAKLAVVVIDQELARQDVKAKFVKRSYGEIDTYQLGDILYMAVAGSAIVVSSKEENLKKALDLHTGKAKGSMADSKLVIEAAKKQPEGAYATAWVNMDPVRKTPGAAGLYTTPRDTGLAILGGSYLDSLGRAPYVAAAVVPEPDGVSLIVRSPAGRDGAGPEKALHMPATTEVMGTRPLLRPKGAFFSYSFYFDFAKFWEDRAKIFNEQTAMAIEAADKGSPLVLSGAQLSNLYTQAGPYHRIVVATQPKYAYTKQPKVTIPAFAFVTELREPAAFAKAIEPAIRSAALFGAFSQANLKMVESTHEDIPIVGYRFPEDKPLPVDVNDIRFGFTPCFCRVGNQFVVSSTKELCEELIDLLLIEAKEGAKGSPATSRMRFYSAGVADQLQADVATLVTQAVLDQALSAEDATAQVKDFIKLLRGLGSLTFESTFSAKELQYVIRIKK